MLRYTFFRLTDDVHRKWRGPAQMRPRFGKKAVYKLDEENLRMIIISKIERDETGRNLPGRWMVVEHDSNNRFMIEIKDHEVDRGWF